MSDDPPMKKQARFCQPAIVDEICCISKHKDPGPGKLPKPYFMGSAAHTYMTWDQVMYSPIIKDSIPNSGIVLRDKFSLYYSNVKRVRIGLMPYTPSKGPDSWHKELDIPLNDHNNNCTPNKCICHKAFLHWQPNFKRIYEWPFNEWSTNFMFKLLHHSYESADRLGNYVQTDKCHCGEIETTSHVFAKCHIIKAWKIVSVLYKVMFKDNNILDHAVYLQTE